MKLIFGCPTYGPTEPEANISVRIAIMHAAGHGHEWLGDASPNRQGWEAARNNIVQSVVNSDYPDDAAIFWCDSDVVLPNDAITRLADHGKDFVCGIYFQRRAPHFPLVATFDGSGFNWIMKWPENVIAPIDGCGFGCVLTSLGMLRKMEAPWFKFAQFSEDFDFCMKAQKSGYQLYMDTGVLCTHLQDPKGAGFEEFKRENPQFYGGDDVTKREGPQGNMDLLGDRKETGEAGLPEAEVQPCAVRG